MRCVHHRNKYLKAALSVCVALIGFAFAASMAAAAPKPRTGKLAKPPVVKKAQPAGSGCGSEKPTLATAVRSTPSRAGKSAPQWSCPGSEVVNPPIWQGEAIECEFLIHNEGQADLNIKAKGG